MRRKSALDIRGLSIFGTAMVLAAPALAEQHVQLFVAPSGQPFWAQPGETYPSAAWFAAADKNKDGKVDRTEFVADFTAYLATLDKDHDGKVSRAEIDDYENEALPGILGRTDVAVGKRTPLGPSPSGMNMYHAPSSVQGASDDRSISNLQSATSQPSAAQIARMNDLAIVGDASGGAAPYSLISIPEPVRAMDINFDGSVSNSEMMSAASRRFKLIAGDNSDLTMKELPRTRAE